MPVIVEFPTFVQDAVERFGSVFANEPEHRHFAEYFTGLMVAEKKNAARINAEFAREQPPAALPAPLLPPPP